MSKSKRKKESIAKSEDLKFDPGLWAKFEEKMSVSMADQRTDAKGVPIVPEVRRTKVSVVIRPEQCALGAFDEPFKVTLHELTPAEELEVLKRVQGASEMALAVELGKAAIRLMNGVFLHPDQVDTLWENLNMAGRLALGMAFMDNCSGLGGDSLVKSLKSAELG